MRPLRPAVFEPRVAARTCHTADRDGLSLADLACIIGIIRSHAASSRRQEDAAAGSTHRHGANSLRDLMTKPLFPEALALAFLAAAGPGQADAAGEGRPVDFNDQVRPILSRHCFKCHGPDEKARKAKLRLDVEDGAMQAGRLGRAADRAGQARRERAGAADLRRGRRTSGCRRPRPSSPLSDGDRQILKQWIADGAKYDAHWAFRQPVRPAMPAVRDRELGAKRRSTHSSSARLEAAKA